MPSEVREAIYGGSFRTVRLRADYGSSVEALVVRVSGGFWIHIAEKDVIATVYHVSNGEPFEKWSVGHLRNPSDRVRLVRQRPVMTSQEMVTAELADIWLKA